MITGYENVEEASGRLGVDESSIRRYCRSGRLQSLKWAGQWHVVKGAPLEGEPDFSAFDGEVSFLSAEEVAEKLGVDVGVIRWRARRGELPALRGNGWRSWHFSRECVKPIGGVARCASGWRLCF